MIMDMKERATGQLCLSNSMTAYKLKFLEINFMYGDQWAVMYKAAVWVGRCKVNVCGDTVTCSI